ncbi:hypothetical protein GCM10010218_63980 [Streptomyces mashuensis]|uniref:Histidine kinase/HSP90-like ATPase domain-containing protein n=1 Tax=Streptomyces mashuensis TaxID=33904 RepID=A0A919EGC4_9ACTN|nr:ATP-binding protein [Streptomyces mashuensis]GHF74061.1 hypothetical protein GCM10010218_63980 [Streptomyces mashuensis]
MTTIRPVRSALYPVPPQGLPPSRPAPPQPRHLPPSTEPPAGCPPPLRQRRWCLRRTSTMTPCLARRRVREALRDWGITERAEDAELIVSEMVTNAVLHGGGRTVVVAVAADSQAIRLGVTDRGRPRGPIVPLRAAPDDEYGRGLALIAATANDSGSHTTRRGKTRVWALLLRHPGGTAGRLADIEDDAAGIHLLTCEVFGYGVEDAAELLRDWWALMVKHLRQLLPHADAMAQQQRRGRGPSAAEMRIRSIRYALEHQDTAPPALDDAQMLARQCHALLLSLGQAPHPASTCPLC